MALDRLTEVHFRLPGCQRCENGVRREAAHGALGVGLAKDVHNLWPDIGQFIFEKKNQDFWNNRQDLLTVKPLMEMCDLFTSTCLNFEWKYLL